MSTSHGHRTASSLAKMVVESRIAPEQAPTLLSNSQGDLSVLLDSILG
jgi:hypothetical protein